MTRDERESAEGSVPVHSQANAAESAPHEVDEPLPVLVNSSAGLDRRDLVQRVTSALRDAGRAGRIEMVTPDAIAGLLERTVRTGVEVVGVAGGDGTLLTAAGVLAGRSTALAPFPTGTLNHFARRLGLHDLPTAAAAVKRGVIATLPLGIVDDRVFLNTATFGFYADMVRRRERLRKGLTKWPAAAVAFALTLLRLRAMDVTLVIDGRRLERTTSLVWVGVGWGSFPFVHEAPERRAQPDLEIVILAPTGPLTSLALLVRLILQVRQREKPIQDRAIEILHAQQILIHADRRIGVTLDGEVLRCEPPILVAIQHDALRVVMPDLADPVAGGPESDREGTESPRHRGDE